MCTFWLFLMHSLSFINKKIPEQTSQTNICLFAGTEQAWNFLKKDAVPSIFTWTKESSLVTYHCPADFKRKFPSTRVIVDATEICIKQPSNPKAQSLILQLQTCKHYEGTCWCDSKCLDFLCFWFFGGSSSYRQVVERTTLSLAKFCDPHDPVMTDKGFNVQDIFASRNVHINIPAFFKGRTGWLQQHDKRTEKLPASESMLKGWLVWQKCLPFVSIDWILLRPNWELK